MSTQPSQEFLNQERLTDLAQAVVTDEHNLWPAIERQARSAMTRSPIRRASFLSRGRPALWFVAGALAVVVTLGIFALGTAGLLFSPDQESAAVAQPDGVASPTPVSFATFVPTPPASASQALMPTSPKSVSETPVPTVPTGFEASLTGDDLTRYRALPVEFQAALSAEAQASGVGRATELLRGLPESIPPLQDILSANGRGLLENADERLQRALLLEGYPDAVDHGDLLNGKSAWQVFEEMVMDATISSRRPWYPPIDETLTSEALAKLEAVDPFIARAFRLVWEFGWDPTPSMDEFEQALLAAPMTMPSIDEMELPAENVRLFKTLPDIAQDRIWHVVAAGLTLAENPADNKYLSIETLTFFNEPSSRDALDLGVFPRPNENPAAAFSPPLPCLRRPAAWPPGTVAIEPEDLPLRPVYLPPPGEVLSETALNNLRSMDLHIREQFSRWWGNVYLPAQLNCTIARWDRQLSNIPMLLPPTPDELLSPESLNTYSGFHPSQQNSFEFVVAQTILNGLVYGEEPSDAVYFDGDLDAFMDALRDWAERWVAEFAEQNRRDLPPGVAPPVGETWVSEDGFIQFTTGAEPLIEPLPGTHPWCVNPLSAPNKPGPFLEPSELPEGMVQTRRDDLAMGRIFQGGNKRISMMQRLCTTIQLKDGYYEEVPIGDRTAYVRQGAYSSGGTPVFDPDIELNLVMDIGYGIVMVYTSAPRQFGITVEDLVLIASSLVPEELTEAEKGPFPQAVLEALGPSFGPIYVPGHLPDSYEMEGQLHEAWLAPTKASELRYVRKPTNDCRIYLTQAASGRRFSGIVEKAQRGDESHYFVKDETGKTVMGTGVWKAMEIDGVTLYAQEFTVPPFTADVYFQAHEVWFYLRIDPNPDCGHTLDMAAEIAASLEPLQQ